MSFVELASDEEEEEEEEEPRQRNGGPKKRLFSYGVFSLPDFQLEIYQLFSNFLLLVRGRKYFHP